MTKYNFVGGAQPRHAASIHARGSDIITLSQTNADVAATLVVHELGWSGNPAIKIYVDALRALVFTGQAKLVEHSIPMCAMIFSKST